MGSNRAGETPRSESFGLTGGLIVVLVVKGNVLRLTAIIPHQAELGRM